MPDASQRVNDKLWSRRDLVKVYARRDLRPVEVMLLVRYREELSGGVLELGCGAGRLTGYLAELADVAHGVDISPAMVDHCRGACPGAIFSEGDLRDLSAFAPGSFDVAARLTARNCTTSRAGATPAANRRERTLRVHAMARIMLGGQVVARTFGQPPGSSPARHPLADATDMNDQIRQIIAVHGRMRVDAYALDDHDDLYRAGMTSHASVNVMLALEDAFDIEFPDAMLTRSVFESIASIAAALMELEAMAA